MPDLTHEKSLEREGYRLVAGVDEAGRGPLAGPVVAGAVIVPADFEHRILDDSKKLTERRREELYAEITTDPRISWSTARVDEAEIDRINILQATWKAMRLALERLQPAPDIALIDGKPVGGLDLVEHRALVKGDSISLSIAAASILAKVERDGLMRRYGQEYPEYGFERHKGYGTKQHREAIRRHGPCPIHRRTFAPVARAERARSIA